MSKMEKFFRSPYLFIKNMYHKNKQYQINSKNLMLGFHINDWKRSFIETIYPDKNIVYVPFKVSDEQLQKKWIPLIKKNNADILVWGMNLPEIIQKDKTIHSKITYVEDGFLRSIGLGSNHTLPASLNFDSQSLYFDSNKPTDLEDILNTYDFDSDVQLMHRAEKLRETLLNTGISKYNHSENVADIHKIYGKKNKKRILVIGQVEDDASIKYGSKIKYTNNDLVRIAVFENPDAQVIYKPHPDVLHQKREKLSDPKEVANICQVLTEDIPLAQSFETVDQVYTISSQAGFEALLRNIKVTTLGCPFYSGWGCTDDRQVNVRRNRKLTVNQILAAAYILYPKYYHPLYKSKEVIVEEILDYLNTAKKQQIKQNSNNIVLIRNTLKRSRSYFIQHFYPNKVIFPKLSELKTVYENEKFYIDTFINNGEPYKRDNVHYLYPGFLSMYFDNYEYTSLMIDSKNIDFEFTKSNLNNILFLKDNNTNNSINYLDKLRAFYRLIIDNNKLSDEFILVIGSGDNLYDVRDKSIYSDIDMLNIAEIENKNQTIIFVTNYNVNKNVLPYYSNNIVLFKCDKSNDIHLLRLMLNAKKTYIINDKYAFHSILFGDNPIIVLGNTWFSHLGLTEDRLHTNRKEQIQLSVEQFFDKIFLQYTSYIHPIYRNKCDFNDFIEYWLNNTNIIKQK